MNNQQTRINEAIWEIYASEHGGEARAIFDDASIPSTAICELPAFACCYRSTSDAVEFFLERYRVESSARSKVKVAVEDILNIERFPLTSVSREFLTQCAELHIMMWNDMYKGRYKRPSLPKCSSRNAVLVDMASGPEFINFFATLEPGTTYFAIDQSFFAIECIRLKAEAEGLRNVKAIQKNVLELTRADIPTSFIEIIRAKNIFTYVPDYLSSFHQHLGWLPENGSFVFSEQSSKKEANKMFIHELIKHNLHCLIDRGWGFKYTFGDCMNPLDLNVIRLLRQGGSEKEVALHELEKFYTELTERYDFS